MKTFYFFYFCFFLNVCYSQIPVKDYKEEIENLKLDIEFDLYWNNLLEIDQKILVKAKNKLEADSISTSLMIRTVLMFEIHGNKVYKPQNLMPILNLSHNNIGKSSVVFWPIIERCKKVGGIIDSFGGVFPTYQLESISLNFYNYSLINQNLKYPELREKLNQINTNNILNSLLESYNNEKVLNNLKEKKSVGKWNQQSFKSVVSDDFFEFVKMDDNAIYIRKNDKIQKLYLLSKRKGIKVFRIEDEPFGWIYELHKDGNLYLKDKK